EFTGACDVVGASAFGEQPVVSDAVQAFWQHVGEKAADELVGGECHNLLPFALLGAVVLPFEGHTSLVERDQTTVGDCHAVGVARQIGQHRLGMDGARRSRAAYTDYFFDCCRRARAKKSRATVSKTAEICSPVSGTPSRRSASRM